MVIFPRNGGNRVQNAFIENCLLIFYIFLLIFIIKYYFIILYKMLELKISWYINFTELLLLLYINLFFFTKLDYILDYTHTYNIFIINS